MYFERCKDYLRLPKNNENFINFVSERFFLLRKTVTTPKCTRNIVPCHQPYKPCKIQINSVCFFPQILFRMGKVYQEGVNFAAGTVYINLVNIKRFSQTPLVEFHIARDQRNVNHNYANQFMQSSGKVYETTSLWCMGARRTGENLLTFRYQSSKCSLYTTVSSALYVKKLGKKCVWVLDWCETTFGCGNTGQKP